MARIERQVSINAPVEKVFSYLADLPRHAEWAAHRLQLQQTSEGPLGVGTTFDSVGHMMRRGFKDQVTVTEHILNERIAFEAVGDSGRFRHWFQLQDQGGQTRVAKGIEPLRVSPRILAPILTAFVAPRALQGDLKRIKAKLEA